MPLLADPIGDRWPHLRGTWNRLRNALVNPSSGWPGKSPRMVSQDLVDGGRIEGRQAWIWRRR